MKSVIEKKIQGTKKIFSCPTCFFFLIEKVKEGFHFGKEKINCHNSRKYGFENWYLEGVVILSGRIKDVSRASRQMPKILEADKHRTKNPRSGQ